MESNYRNIKDTYKIERTIGKGSFATVRKCKNRATGEYFAVKILSKRKMAPEDKASLQQEIDIMKQIDHPNIVKMIDFFEDEGHYCIVMEMMQGGELFEQILNREQFSESEAREAIKSIIDAISYCHSLNIVHRDIKPENLLLHSKDLDLTSLKISDFGLARFVKADQVAQTQCGTPGYVAPEILMEQPYGKECDYWSIGVVLYILLSGSPPFFEDERADLFEKIKTAQYEFDDATWGNISNEAKNLVENILRADPSQRLNCDQMLAHPWMSMDLEDKTLKMPNLSNYIKQRQEVKKINNAGDGGGSDEEN